MNTINRLEVSRPKAPEINWLVESINKAPMAALTIQDYVSFTTWLHDLILYTKQLEVYMPAKSEKQRKAMAIALKSPKKLLKRNKKLAEMPKNKLKDFARKSSKS